LGRITPASADILFQYALFEEALGNQNLLFQDALLDGRLRLLSYAFLHGDFWHLAGNMLFLWVFGDNVEDDLGHGGFLLFYLGAAMLSGLAHTLFTAPSMTPLVGASGAVSGVMAAYVVAHPKVRVWVLVLGRIPLPIPALWLIIAWGGLQLVSIFIFSDSAVSYAAHLGGLAAGFAIFPLVRRKATAS
jgi:membrane associated rhomboid family serine protease